MTEQIYDFRPAVTARNPRTPAAPLLTSAEAARTFRVGVSSIKRWTDDGELEAVRTPGGHRRYNALALHRFASIRGLSTDLLPPIAEINSPSLIPPPADITLFQALISGDEDSVRKLVTPRMETLSKRAAFLDRVVGEALREIGYRWDRGELGIDQEHRASHMVVDAIDGLRPTTAPNAPVALLACPPEEWHDLPLRLLRLVLEWAGWRTEFLGAALPWPSAQAARDRARPRVFALTARTGDPFQSRDFDRFVEFCNNRGTQVVIGGEWARGGTGAADSYQRFRTLRGFERWLRTV